MTRQYFSFADYTRDPIGSAAGKISIDIGFGCAHQKRTGGCSFCSLAAFAPSYTSPALSVEEQWQRGKKFSRHARNYAYLQLGTNTGPGIDVARILAPIAEDTSLSGIMIGTRPDALDATTISALSELASRYDVWMEMGMQSMDNAVLAHIDRGHTFEQFMEAALCVQRGKIRVSAHVIFGLPGEAREGMLAGIRELAKIPVDGMKFHQLSIVRGTKIADLYAREPFPLLDERTYADIVAHALTMLPASVVIERLVGDSHSEYLIAPRWKAGKHEVIAMIRERLEEMNAVQGTNAS